MIGFCHRIMLVCRWFISLLPCITESSSRLWKTNVICTPRSVSSQIRIICVDGQFKLYFNTSLYWYLYIDAPLAVARNIIYLLYMILQLDFHLTIIFLVKGSSWRRDLVSYPRSPHLSPINRASYSKQLATSSCMDTGWLEKKKIISFSTTIFIDLCV